MSSSINIKEDPDPHPDQLCIYRVPKSIRKGNQEAYTPQIVSIGPLHYGREDLKGMEKQKQNYVAKFFEERTDKKREEVLAFIINQEQKIRKCYSEAWERESEVYVGMILRDAIFVIELFMRKSGNHKSDFFINTPAEMYALQLDLLLLENQLPYFLLEDLYKFLVPKGESFRELCLNFFRDQMFFPDNPKTELKNEFKHFTGMQRAALVGDFKRKMSTFCHLPCATKLQESGVKFRCASKERCPLEIKFKQGELRIPELSVFHETDTILRNIMALEQCCYHGSLVVCSYVQLLDFLIEDKRDAQLLVDEGIIRNWMGDSKALANLFNKLCVEIPLAENHYPELYKDLNDHCGNSWNRNKARLKNFYFGDIWKGTATVAAAIILLLTFIQTMYNVKEWIY
ncbi:UPF0481 protein At3g47200-like [Mangifera indica]|uniref:UPF0481 protein At3g47200-like n=1 Tax=Mangifera indica TaxID=29780 RepID=UPI001CF95824|nr:UPF0481 protein At3g47200-like [Mangifera indica]XP_044481477.1 UPF0481 protein At3g47200-like [Mangifera indica]